MLNIRWIEENRKPVIILIVALGIIAAIGALVFDSNSWNKAMYIVLIAIFLYFYHLEDMKSIEASGGGAKVKIETKDNPPFRDQNEILPPPKKRKTNKRITSPARDMTRIINELNERIAEIDVLAKESHRNEKFNAWKTETKICLIDAFGADSLYVKNFDDISYSLSVFISETPDSYFQEAYLRGLREAKELLNRCLLKLERTNP